jgi:N-hydroxyarylamine O-acetyltransferase
MNTDAYLARIKYSGDVDPSSNVLLALQEAHLLTVPFENLDIHAEREIRLDPGVLFAKIVTMKRGGFCYELNGLFNLLLTEMGFRAALVSGRVFDRSRNTYGPEFDHMLSLVNVDGLMWLVDVGFGDFSMHPLRVFDREPQTDVNGQFLIEPDNHGSLVVSRFVPNEERYVPEYMFSLTERRLGDFSEMCRYHQTSSGSHFTQQRVCSIATTTGRITLMESRLILTNDTIKTEMLIRNEAEYRDALVRYFDIKM